MKRLSVIIPSIILGLFLFNSFLLKEKDSGKVSINTERPSNAIFKSTDGGQTWHDISKGLPRHLLVDGIRGDSIIANDKGLFLRVGKEVYHNTPDAAAPFWTKEVLPKNDSSLVPGNSEILAHNFWNANFKKRNGTTVWSPLFKNSRLVGTRSAFETAGGTVFIGTNEGIFKTENDGKTWKQVYAGGFVGHLAEADGVLLAIGMKRLLRSTDNGENWALAISEDSVAFDVKTIKGGFAAITSNSETNTPETSRLSTSYDGGKTWQPIDAGNKVFNDSIMVTWDDRPDVRAFQGDIRRVGDKLFCVHRDGIFKSSDKGHTWQLLLPSVRDRFFNLVGSGDVIYAITSKGGC